jgi:Fe-S-cluster containining protein
MSEPLPNNLKEVSKLEIAAGKINFACLKEKCPTPCCGPFGGVQRGIDSVDGRKFNEIVLTPEDTTRLLEGGCAHLIERTADGGHRMRLHEDGTCIAFVNGLCSIHTVKPTLCRAFPFYVDMFVGLCGCTDCPGFGKGWTPLEQLEPEIQAAEEMYSFWLASLKMKRRGAGMGEKTVEDS